MEHDAGLHDHHDLGERIRCCVYTFNMGNNSNLEITDLLVPVPVEVEDPGASRGKNVVKEPTRSSQGRSSCRKPPSAGGGTATTTSQTTHTTPPSNHSRLAATSASPPSGDDHNSTSGLPNENPRRRLTASIVSVRGGGTVHGSGDRLYYAGRGNKSRGGSSTDSDSSVSSTDEEEEQVQFKKGIHRLARVSSTASSCSSTSCKTGGRSSSILFAEQHHAPFPGPRVSFASRTSSSTTTRTTSGGPPPDGRWSAGRSGTDHTALQHEQPNRRVDYTSSQHQQPPGSQNSEPQFVRTNTNGSSSSAHVYHDYAVDQIQMSRNPRGPASNVSRFGGRSFEMPPALEASSSDMIESPATTRDLIFFSFAETQSALTPFVKKWKKQLADKRGLDICEQTNARIEHQEKFGGGMWQSLTAKLATNWNGNLKTLLLAKSSVFQPQPKTFFGICPEHENIPNPKKAFSGKELRLRNSKVKILCIGAHFPIGKIARHLEQNTYDVGWRNGEEYFPHCVPGSSHFAPEDHIVASSSSCSSAGGSDSRSRVDDRGKKAAPVATSSLSGETSAINGSTASSLYNQMNHTGTSTSVHPSSTDRIRPLPAGSSQYQHGPHQPRTMVVPEPPDFYRQNLYNYQSGGSGPSTASNGTSGPRNGEVNGIPSNFARAHEAGSSHAVPPQPQPEKKHALSRGNNDVLESCKYVMARNLRRMLARAAEAGMLDNDTLVMLSGDVNSRTLLLFDPGITMQHSRGPSGGASTTTSSTSAAPQQRRGGNFHAGGRAVASTASTTSPQDHHHQFKSSLNTSTYGTSKQQGRLVVKDLLTETLRDRRYCAAISNRLVEGTGNWIDLSTACGTQHWVTYKFHENYEQKHPLSVEDMAHVLNQPNSLDRRTRSGSYYEQSAAVVSFSSNTEHFEVDKNSSCTNTGSSANGEPRDAYAAALDRISAFEGPGALYRDRADEGKRFKRFHFPAAADRVLLFQPRGGAVDQLHVDELDIVVVSEQQGSDHKPLVVVFDLYVKPASSAAPNSNSKPAKKQGQQQVPAGPRAHGRSAILKSAAPGYYTTSSSREDLMQTGTGINAKQEGRAGQHVASTVLPNKHTTVLGKNTTAEMKSGGTSTATLETSMQVEDERIACEDKLTRPSAPAFSVVQPVVVPATKLEAVAGGGAESARNGTNSTSTGSMTAITPWQLHQGSKPMQNTAPGGSAIPDAHLAAPSRFVPTQHAAPPTLLAASAAPHPTHLAPLLTSTSGLTGQEPSVGACELRVDAARTSTATGALTSNLCEGATSTAAGVHVDDEEDFVDAVDEVDLHDEEDSVPSEGGNENED
ncbi:unnamed protein product [Amoebophrya sp. A120]|nr:unnamed protein product [Amoebophrya sp. A120]|eukprot:GSA120T00017679001.1